MYCICTPRSNFVDIFSPFIDLCPHLDTSSCSSTMVFHQFPSNCQSIAEPAFAVLDLPSVPSTRLSLPCRAPGHRLLWRHHIAPHSLQQFSCSWHRCHPLPHRVTTSFTRSSAWTFLHLSIQHLLDSSLTLTLTVRHCRSRIDHHAEHLCPTRCHAVH